MLVAIFLFSVPVQDVSGGVFFLILLLNKRCYRALRCSYAQTASSMETQSRKVLGILKSRGMHAPTLTEDGKDLMARELRAVPSGPDPLHHNGGAPKKPRTP
ncbi:hypothetical protein K2173_014056 [Erythroxylum novogranatense]|uniref:Uncharacterized protein n=1 Tax=Erythroxylum novogranatense TaxID=1862640 RepID=A0AAV8SD52_9ROSI|nr:hypothetical protein K2173_014056 [Erythroxylum novogranatense]